MRKLVLGAGLTGIIAVGVLIGATSVAPTRAKKGSDGTSTGAANPASTNPQPGVSTAVAPSQNDRLDMARRYGNLPLAFEQNKGQAKHPVKFVARGDGYALLLSPTGMDLALRTSAQPKRGDQRVESHTPQAIGSYTSTDPSLPRHWASRKIRVELVGANNGATFTALDELPGKSNYLIGNNPQNWHTKIPNFRKVAERSVYDGVDLIYYGTQRQLEYDFVVAPGADPAAIQLAIRGAEKLRTDSRGNLVIRLGGDEARLMKPVAYQETEHGRTIVASNYVLKSADTVAFHVGNYDPSRALVIDPILSYSTYLGGSNIDGANAIAVAPDKTAFITGGTFSLDFPTVHPLQPNHGGPDDVTRDAFVAKLSADGSTLLYSTYLGGKNEDVGNGIAADGFGNAYVTGTTESGDFPTPSIVPSFNPLCGGDGQCGATWNPQGFIVSNGFVTKLNPEGSGILYSGFVGFYEYVSSQAIAVDANQSAYITGRVGPNITPTVIIVPPKTPPPPFPITPNAAQPAFGGGATDAFVWKISATGAVVEYSTYLGGSDEEIGYGIAADSSANAYVTGITYSSNFPVVNPVQATFGGAGDAFFSKVSTDGSGAGPGPLLYSTYLGGSNLDQGNGVALDSTGIAYIAGSVGAGALPFGTIGTFNGGDSDAFAAKIDATKVGAASLLYFRYFGGSLADSGNGIAVDPSGNAYVTGSTVSPDFPITPAIFQSNYGGGNADAFVTKIDPTGATLLYSTFLGGTNTDIGYGIAVDATGAAYVAGQTCSLDFPLANPLQAAPGGNCDAFVSKVEILNGIELNPSGLLFNGQSLNTTSQPQVVTLTNGDSPQTITSIMVIGPNNGDFSETTTCPIGSVLPPGALCTISVTFTPSAAGIRKAQIQIMDSAPGSPQVLDLTGTTSTLSLSQSNLPFGEQHVGVTSAPLPIIATNNGSVPISFSSITASGDFAETDNCTKVPLQPTTNCVINVTYTPSTAGASVGALTLTDNAPGSPQIVLLTGTGFGEQSDFTLTVLPPSATVPAGKPAQFTLTLTSFGGFAQPVTLECEGLPKSTACEGSANPVTPTSTGANVTLLITTGTRTLLPVNRPVQFNPPSARQIWVFIWTTLVILLLLSATMVRWRPRAAGISALAIVIAMLMVSAACSGGSQQSQTPGTPAGSFPITIVGTTGQLTHKAVVMLNVN